jgi:hypothetical protein
MNIWIFSLAAFLTLPKQFITVYLGVLLEQSADGSRTTRDTIISDVVLAVTFLITVVAAWWIWREMSRVRVEVLRERRAERKAKLAEAGQGMELGKYGSRGQSEDTSTDYSHTQLQAMMSTDRLKAASTDHLAGAPFNPRDSDDAFALGSARSGGPSQRWDNYGRAVAGTDVYVGGPYDSGRRQEPIVPPRAYDGNGDAYGGLEYAPYDPYASSDNLPPSQYPPQAQSSRSPPPRTSHERSVSPPKQSLHSPPPQQPVYPPSQPSFPTQQRYELFDPPVQRHQQDSTIGSYRTAYDG